MEELGGQFSIALFAWQLFLAVVLAAIVYFVVRFVWRLNKITANKLKEQNERKNS